MPDATQQDGKSRFGQELRFPCALGGGIDFIVDVPENAVLQTDFGYEAERKDLERSEQALDRAVSGSPNGRARRAGIEMAIVMAYETRAKREGARFWIEHAHSR